MKRRIRGGYGRRRKSATVCKADEGRLRAGALEAGGVRLVLYQERDERQAEDEGHAR